MECIDKTDKLIRQFNGSIPGRQLSMAVSHSNLIYWVEPSSLYRQFFQILQLDQTIRAQYLDFEHRAGR
jgi:hypothetical protein